MLRVPSSFFLVVLHISLCVHVFSDSAPTPFPSPQIIYGQTSIEWPAVLPDAPCLLTLTGPGGLYLKQEQPANNWPRFSLTNDHGEPRPDGVYKWELVVQSGWDSQGQSGWFQLERGRVVAEGTGEQRPVVVEQNAPHNSLYVDEDGRVGIGTSVPGAQLHLKGSSPAIAIEDTRAGGREYRLRSQESGDGSLGLFDEQTGQARWLADGEGRLGINTTAPTSTLTVDGYIESTKGFLVNGRPVGGVGVGMIGGSQPLYTESSNSFFGQSAGYSNTGSYNSFFGVEAGYSNMYASSNSFFGHRAGRLTTEGGGNAFFGAFTGIENTTGGANSFFGGSAGNKNTTGMDNSFVGGWAGRYNTTGSHNSFFGSMSGSSNTVEDYNTFIGELSDGWAGITNATALGYRAQVRRSNSLVLGGIPGFNGAMAETYIGIGTPTPDRQLVVEGSQAVGKFRRYSETTPSHSPAFLFERARGTNTASADILPGDYLGKVQFRGRVGGNMPEYGALAFIASDTSQNGRFSFVDRDLVTERMVILNSGNVGIGTNAPTEALDVNGNLRVRGGILYGAPAVPVPDYVFEPGYRLTPLGELEQYVKAQKHLPDIPSATEIENRGVNLGEFQMRLLQKVEELSLYAMHQERANSRLKEEVARQKAEAEALRQRTASQEDRIRRLEETVKVLADRNQGRR